MRGLQNKKVSLTSNHAVCTTNIQLIKDDSVKIRIPPLCRHSVLLQFYPTEIAPNFSYTFGKPILSLAYFFFGRSFVISKASQEHNLKPWKVPSIILPERIQPHSTHIHQKEPWLPEQSLFQEVPELPCADDFHFVQTHKHALHQGLIFPVLLYNLISGAFTSQDREWAHSSLNIFLLL